MYVSRDIWYNILSVFLKKIIYSILRNYCVFLIFKIIFRFLLYTLMMSEYIYTISHVADVILV
jgi:hypothetical protein